MKTINLLMILLLTAVIAYPQHRVMQVHSAGEVAYEINTAQVDSVVFRASLANTMWKLAGIMDVNTGVLKELEPKDCEECFTLVFDTNNTFSGRITTNIITGSYYIDYETHALHFTNIGGTEAIDVGDGELYRQILWKIQFFTAKETYPPMLHLYYDENKKYLLFKSQEL